MNNEVIWNIKAEDRTGEHHVFMIRAPNPKDLPEQQQHELIDGIVQQFLALHDMMPIEVGCNMTNDKVVGVDE